MDSTDATMMEGRVMVVLQSVRQHIAGQLELHVRGRMLCHQLL